MTEPAFVHIDAETAKAAVLAAAFTDDEGRTTVHAFVHSSGMAMGADWDIDSVIEQIENAKEIAWVDHPIKHDLAVLGPDGPCHYFAARKPLDNSGIPEGES